MIVINNQTESFIGKITNVLTIERIHIKKDDIVSLESDILWGYTIKYFLLFFWAIPWAVVMGNILGFSMIYWGCMQFYFVILFLFFLTTKDYHILSLTYAATSIYFITTLPTKQLKSTYLGYYKTIAFIIANILVALFFFLNRQLKIFSAVTNNYKIKTKPDNFKQLILKRLSICLIVSAAIGGILSIYTLAASKPIPSSKNYEVEFLNKGLEKAVRKQLNIDDDKTIMRKDLDSIQGMELTNKAVTFSTKYEYDYTKWSENNLLYNFESLESIVGTPQELEEETTTIKDIKHFRKLKYLKIISDGKFVIYNLDDLQCLEDLETLKIKFSDRFNTNIKQLCNVKSLKYLSLNHSKLENVNFAKNLSSLTTLKLEDCSSLEDISAITECDELKHLAIDNCDFSNTDTIAKMTNLTYLSLMKNAITNIDFVKDLKELEFLDLHSNMISDIKVLANNTNLKYLFLLKNNNINDISSLYNLTKLKYLWLEDDKKNETENIKSKDIHIYTGL